MRNTTWDVKVGFNFGTAAVLALLMAVSTVRAKDCDKDCPKNDSVDQNQGAGDPVFMFVDPRPATTIVMAQAGLVSKDSVSSQQLSDKDRALLKEIEGRILAKPDKAFDEALSAWKGSYSKELQSAVVLQAMKAVRTTDEQGLLRFMLDSLNNPAAQRQEISKLGRGNRLEQKIAEKRLAIINQNPQLASK